LRVVGDVEEVGCFGSVDGADEEVTDGEGAGVGLAGDYGCGDCSGGGEDGEEDLLGGEHFEFGGWVEEFG
jgi:hypothetical protein